MNKKSKCQEWNGTRETYVNDIERYWHCCVRNLLQWTSASMYPKQWTMDNAFCYVVDSAMVVGIDQVF